MERSVIDLVGLVTETVALLRNSPELRPDHRVVEVLPDEPVHYNGDPNQIRQIFWNLARNAIQAMPQGGELRISLDAQPRSELAICFADTGQGMTREQVERLFEPFNSTSGGTGLGMAIVYQLVRDHNGKVLVESELANGTSITIKLPVAARVSGRRSRKEVAEPETESVAAAG
jgi:two-component system sensor histidine kinase PilS (NtrC family)